jgi:hypothetical protein
MFLVTVDDDYRCSLWNLDLFRRLSHVCIHVHVYVYVYVYLYVHVYVYVYVYVCMCTCICMYVCIYVCMYLCMCVCMFIHIYADDDGRRMQKHCLHGHQSPAASVPLSSMCLYLLCEAWLSSASIKLVFRVQAYSTHAM